VLSPWIEAVALHPDVLAETFSEDIFALDLGPLADYLAAKELGTPAKAVNVPAVYRDPEHFFRASFLTTGLRGLLKDVLDRLAGGGGNPVLKLVTAFGGGKSHTLASLLHAARNRDALDTLPEAHGLPRPGKSRVAVFDGQFFDAKTGKNLPGTDLRARTMWGWVAWCLGGAEGYAMLREQDEARVAPGGDELVQLLGDRPNLILLDEVLQYLISAGGVKVEKTTLRDETMNFLHRLTGAVSNTQRTALVFSLQSSKRESLEYVSLLQTVDHLAARKDQRREPVEGNEILSVIQRRLLAKQPDLQAATDAAVAYQGVVTHMRRAYARSAAEQQQAEDDGLALRDRLRAAYPFHPALIDLMRERWAAIPDFQRTRGALRFLAACLRATRREAKARALLGPGDVALHDSEVRLAFFKEVGQQSDFQAVLEHDFVGANARVRRIDDRRSRDVPSETGRQPATRLATTILLFSFGGRRRDGEGEGDLLPPGITESELLAACVAPDLDSTTAQACLKELKEQCLYLHYDGLRYCFKKDPNVTLLVEQEADAVARDEERVRTRIKTMIEGRLAGQRSTIVWPLKTADVPDGDAAFLVAYMGLEFGAKKGRDEEAVEFFERAGATQRNYRNGLGLALPSDDQIDALLRSVRYLVAIEQVATKAKQLNLTDAQRDQLKERESTERAAAESALLKLYAEVWLPRLESEPASPGNEESGTQAAGAAPTAALGRKLGIEKIAVGGRPLQATLDGKKQAMIHQRVMELLTTVQPRVFTKLMPAKITQLFKLGEGTLPRLGIKTSEVVAGFYSFLGFTRLTDQSVIGAAIAQGVEKGLFGYTAGSPVLGVDGHYQVLQTNVRIGCETPEDEIDLDDGFLLLPAAIPHVVAPIVVVPAGAIDQSAEGEATPGDQSGSGEAFPEAGRASTPPLGSGAQTTVELSFEADRDQLFSAWNAVANLVDLAGKVKVVVSAEAAAGFDKHKLENAVLEPLRETGLIE
jgi:hypothetical protein